MEQGPLEQLFSAETPILISEPKPLVSPKQLQANRKNPALSTGPQTGAKRQAAYHTSVARGKRLHFIIASGASVCQPRTGPRTAVEIPRHAALPPECR